MSGQKFILRVMNTENAQEYPVDDNLTRLRRPDMTAKVLEYIQKFQLDPMSEIQFVGDCGDIVYFKHGNVVGVHYDWL